MSGAASSPHIPVMCAEIVAALQPKDGAVYVDGTFGAGGYSQALLDAADCAVLAIDRDPSALTRGRDLAARYKGRLTLIEGCFGDMVDLLHDLGVDRVDGVTLDVGVSSMQIDEPARGFSFQKDGPLDMRMSGEGATAAQIVNQLEEKDLARIIAVLGEERRATAIARAIVKARAEKQIERTVELADLVTRVLGKPRPDKIHPATRTFQALRIFVNDELGELARGLAGAETLLAPGGRLAVVAFHSLEDRIVKRFLAERSGHVARPSRHLPEAPAAAAPSFELLFKGAATAGDDEIRVNPRSRSAKLRAATRTSAPAWPLDLTALGVPRLERTGRRS